VSAGSRVEAWRGGIPGPPGQRGKASGSGAKKAKNAPKKIDELVVTCVELHAWAADPPPSSKLAEV
jgi:hypothetical protein